VYRVTYPGRPLLKPATIAGAPIPQLLNLLKEPENRVRYRAKIELSGRDTNQVMAAVDTWVTTLDAKDPSYEHQMMEALWVKQWHNRVDEKLLARMLQSKEPWARAAATRVLCYWRDRVNNPLAQLKKLATDEHPAVRLEAVRAASFFQTASAAEVAAASLSLPQDRFLKYTYDRTMDTLKLFGATAPSAPARTEPPAAPTAAAAPRDTQVITIETIPEKMLFDVRWFAVEAAKPVQISLTNPEAMPHNLVIGAPGSLKEIGPAGNALPMPTDPNAKPFVPDSPKVLYATALVTEDKTVTLSFTAPKEPGEYIFVCTYPGHWTRMNGVMLVVPNMAAWEKAPTVPTDPMTGQPFTAKRN
jgi:azurin